VNLRELGEFGLIKRIAGRVICKDGVSVGIGDDAAAVSPTSGCLTLVTSDMLVEGVHFDLSLCDASTLGRKSLAVNLSDIAAMGARPRHFLLSLAVPPALTVEYLDRFIAGMLEWAAEFDVALIGGDTCSSRDGLVISVTAMGEQQPEKVVRRGGAAPGDLIWVTGTLGDAALGLELLRRGERKGEAVARHLDPTPRVREGLALAEAGLPTAMIDVSDGLLADLGHILEQSGVGARLKLTQLPLSPSFQRSAPVIIPDPFVFPLAGGEDYELLFTTPTSREAAVKAALKDCEVQASVIGEITGDGELTVLDADGRNYPVTARGYNHFSSP
jgi:thiamine-monophosphate kinase